MKLHDTDLADCGRLIRHGLMSHFRNKPRFVIPHANNIAGGDEALRKDLDCRFYEVAMR